MFDSEKVKQAVRLLIEGIGENSQREGLLETPDRVMRVYQDCLAGYDENPADHVKLFKAESHAMITVSNMEFYSYCEHHLEKFRGHISAAYIPNEHIVGLSKIPRIAKAFCRRLQVQERLTLQIADAMQELLKPQGVAVQIRAVHGCMVDRGVRMNGVETITTEVRGLFLHDEKARNEFLQTIN